MTARSHDGIFSSRVLRVPGRTTMPLAGPYPQVNVTQLFDLRADPRELTNLADKPEHAARVQELLALLKQEMTAYEDPVPLEVADPKPAAWSPDAAAPRSKGKKAK